MEQLPQKKDLMSATIEVMKQQDRPMNTSEINDAVAEYLNIPEDLLAIEDTNFTGTEYSYRMRWIRTQLKQNGLIVNVKRGEWRLA
ncbi:MAG: winged helix-turn-helix domain-containing protein [Lachnospiraceae bacterium]|nr:winged helix-turn-helix domain-containing protein [Lachnospiraceae bacterium]